MSVTKREVSLAEVLGTYLSYTPNYAETEQFRSDLRTMNHTLLRDAIEECKKANKAPKGAAPQTKRHLIHSVYMRKVKELASIYPFLFAVENALRSVAAERYMQVFNSAFWWKVFTQAYQAGKSADDFPLQANGKKLVRGVPVNPAFIKEIFFAIEKMANRQRDVLYSPNSKAISFYEEMTLRNLANIIKSDWGHCPLGSLNKTDFQTHIGIICEARNEVFHSNPIKNRTAVFKACERILDSVDFHLGDFDQTLRQVSYARPAPAIEREARHCIPPLQQLG